MENTVSDETKIAVQVRLTQADLDVIDQLRAKEKGIPSRAEMCRKILTGEAVNMPPKKPKETATKGGK